MEDRKLADRLRMILSGLSARISVCEEMEVPEDSLSRTLPGTRLAVCCPADTPGGEDLLRMALAVADGISTSTAPTDERSVLRRAITGEAADYELASLSDDSDERILMAFRVLHTGGEDADELLRDLIPMQDGDQLVAIDRHTAVMVRKPAPDETEEEMIQFAEALQETLLAEAALQMTVGISARFSGMARLHTAYTEAMDSIAVGTRFLPDESVFAWRRLCLERFLSEVPPAVCRRYHDLLFNAETAKLFNEEMMTTIDMFFRKDLNLSDTARQLFIHRNTLVYRLDKVMRVTGLDLRTFKDALTFRLLMAMNKCDSPEKH